VALSCQGTLVGVESVNWPADHMRARKLLQETSQAPGRLT
jgi:hypothetical protein